MPTRSPHSRPPSGARSRAVTWFAAARQPRMVGLLVLLLAAALVCARLGAWQLQRAAERSEQAAARAAQDAADVEPVPLADVVAPQTAFTQATVGRVVTVTGRYVQGFEQYLVAEADADGRPGVLVLAAFRVEEGGSAGAILPVVRGRLDGTAEEHSADVGPDGPLASPGGRVRLVGTLSPGEASLDVPTAGRSLGSVSPGQLANLWGSPIYGGYLRLTAAEPPETSALAPARAPSQAGRPLPLQNLAYAVQWWVFGAFALAVWIRLVRDEAARLEE